MNLVVGIVLGWLLMTAVVVAASATQRPDLVPCQPAFLLIK